MRQEQREQSLGPRRFEPKLSRVERRQVERRTAPRAVVLHEAILKEGEEELLRPSSAPAWSSLEG